MSDSAKLTTGSISGHLVSQTAPMLFGIAAIMSIGIVDAYFIGQLGSKELAAVSFIFPITIALSSLGVGVIAGISSVVSRALGSDDPGRAQQLGNLGMVMAVGFGLIVAASLYLLKDPLFRLMQADDDLLPLIDAYMTPYARGFPLLLTNMGGNGVLRGQGAAKRASAILLAFAGANWILDPILITGIGSFAGFGVAGAAYATIAGWAIGTVLAIVFVQSSEIKINPACLTAADWGSGVWSLIKVGGPAALSNAINPIGLSILTAFLARYGQDEVAGFGAAGRLQSFAVVPMLGLSSSIGAAVLVLARQWLGGLFSDDAAVLDALSRYLLIAAWGFAGYGVLVVVNGAFNAIDRAPVALGQSAARVFLVMVPFAWLAGAVLGADAIYAGELAANIIGGLGAAALAWYVMRR